MKTSAWAERAEHLWVLPRPLFVLLFLYKERAKLFSSRLICFPGLFQSNFWCLSLLTYKKAFLWILPLIDCVASLVSNILKIQHSFYFQYLFFFLTCKFKSGPFVVKLYLLVLFLTSSVIALPPSSFVPPSSSVIWNQNNFIYFHLLQWCRRWVSYFIILLVCTKDYKELIRLHRWWKLVCVGVGVL